VSRDAMCFRRSSSNFGVTYRSFYLWTIALYLSRPIHGGSVGGTTTLCDGSLGDPSWNMYSPLDLRHSIFGCQTTGCL